MSKLGNAAKTGATWGVAGAATGNPFIAGAATLAGGLYGWFSDTSDEQAAAEDAKLAGMQKAAGVYEGYRPQVASAREQGLNQQLSAYGGAANAMNLMYGSQYDPRSYAPHLGDLPVPHPEGGYPMSHPPSATYSTIAPPVGTTEQLGQVGGGRQGSSSTPGTFMPSPTYGPRYGAPGPAVVTPPKNTGGRY